MAAAPNANRITGEDEDIGEPFSTAGRRRKASVVTQPIALTDVPKPQEDDKVSPTLIASQTTAHRPPRSSSSIYSPRSSSGSEHSAAMSSSRTSVSSSASSLANTSGSSRSKTASSISTDISVRDSVSSSRSTSSGTTTSNSSKASFTSTPAGIGRQVEDFPAGKSVHSHSTSTLPSADHPFMSGLITSYHSESGLHKDATTVRTKSRLNSTSSSLSSVSTPYSIPGSSSNPNSSSSSLGSLVSSPQSSASSLSTLKNLRGLNGEWRAVTNIPTMQFLHIQGRQTQREWVGFKSPSQSTGTPGLVPPHCTAFCACSPDFIRNISDKADPENWGDNYSELSYFIDRTWHRATNLSREHPTIMGFYPDNTEHPFMLLFHTCLLSKDGNGFLYGVLSLAKHKLKKTEPMWIFQDVLTLDTLINAHVMAAKELVGIRRHQLPKKVWYWTSHVSELYYDPAIPIEESFDGHHLFGELGSERRNRLSPPYRGLATSALSARLRESVRMMRLFAEAGPRMVIPQYFWDKHHDDGAGQLQLLLPIAMDYTKPKEIDCCVVLRKEITNNYEPLEGPGASRDKYFYRIISLYSLTMAYSNARLIQPVDAPWLLNGYLQLLKSNSGSSASGTMGSSSSLSSFKSDFISDQGMRVSSGWTSSTDSESSELSNVDSILSEQSADSILSSGGTAASASMPSLDRSNFTKAVASDTLPTDVYGAGGRQNSTSAPNLAAQQKTYSAAVAAKGRTPVLTRKPSNVTTASAPSQSTHQQLRLPTIQMTTSPGSAPAPGPQRLPAIPESPFASRKSASSGNGNSANDTHGLLNTQDQHDFDPNAITAAGSSVTPQDHPDLWPYLPSHQQSHQSATSTSPASSPLTQTPVLGSPPRSPNKSKRRHASSSPAHSPPTSRLAGMINSSSSSSSSSNGSAGKHGTGSPRSSSTPSPSPPVPGSPTETPSRISIDSTSRRHAESGSRGELELSGEQYLHQRFASPPASDTLLSGNPLQQEPFQYSAYSPLEQVTTHWTTDAASGQKIPVQMVSLPQGMFLIGSGGTWPQQLPSDASAPIQAGQMLPLVYMGPPVISGTSPQYVALAPLAAQMVASLPQHSSSMDSGELSSPTSDAVDSDHHGNLSDSSKGSRSRSRAKVIRVGPDIRDYSSTGYVDMVRAVRQWLIHHPNLEPEKCELAQLAVYLRKCMPELKGSGKCFAYATQAYEAGVIDLWPEKKQHYITLTPKGAAMDIGAPKGSRAYREGSSGGGVGGGAKSNQKNKKQSGGAQHQATSSSNESGEAISPAGDSSVASPSSLSPNSPRHPHNNQQQHHQQHLHPNEKQPGRPQPQHHKARHNQHSRRSSADTSAQGRSNQHSRRSSTGTADSQQHSPRSGDAATTSAAPSLSPATSPSSTLSKSSSGGLSKRKGNSVSKMAAGNANRSRASSGDYSSPPTSPASDPAS